MNKFRCDLASVLELRNCDLRIASVAARIKNAEQQDRKHGADAAQCDQAEAVILCAAVASYRGETNAERHDKRNRDRAGRNTARIECDRNEFVRHKGGKDKNCNIEQNKQKRKPYFEDCTQQCEHEEQADTDCDRPDQHAVRDGRDLSGEHLKIRFGDRNQNADQQCDRDDHSKIFCLRQLCADTLAHRRHRNIRAKRKERHADDQQHGTCQEQDKRADRHRRDRHAEYKNDQRDRKHGR